MRVTMLRRSLLLLLLLLLPLQFSWAVVSNYCQHESDGSAAHFGHHPHQHQDEDGAPAASKLAGGDPDCGSCHGGFCSLPCMAATGPDALTAATHYPPYSLLPGCSWQQRPERPNWRHLA